MRTHLLQAGAARQVAMTRVTTDLVDGRRLLTPDCVYVDDLLPHELVNIQSEGQASMKPRSWEESLRNVAKMILHSFND